MRNSPDSLAGQARDRISSVCYPFRLPKLPDKKRIGTMMTSRTWTVSGLAVCAVLGLFSGRVAGQAASTVVSLDGNGWRLATDPQNVGREQRWFETPRPEAKPTKVPWIIQDAFPGYHGVAWYWRDFTAPVNGSAGGRYLLRFGAVDYLADVWLNGKHVGGHEGAEGVFVLDVTDAIKPDAQNLLAVRVLNPKYEPIDGLTLGIIPHRHKGIPYNSGAAANQGGITDSVELMLAPAVRLTDLYARPDWKTGIIHVEATVRNAGQKPASGHLTFTISPAASGETLNTRMGETDFPVGNMQVTADINLSQWRLWELGDPYLYRVTARLNTAPPQSAQPGAAVLHELSTRCGFRDFRFSDGYFRLNGKRVFLKGSHTCNNFPVGLQVPDGPDFARRDLIYAKMAGFNCIRFIAGVPTPYQLDLCDELGLMVYEENYASWCLGDSPQMKERYDRSYTEMIKRDRNHPSVVIWGMLNETPDGPVFRHALEATKLVRRLDKTRLLILNSGRCDYQLTIGSLCNPGSTQWECLLGGQGPNGKPGPSHGVCGYIENSGDIHCYPQVPQSYDDIHLLRTMGQGQKHVLLTEYGIGSAVNWPRVFRQYEQIGKPDVEDAQFYQRIRDAILADWTRYKMDDTWANLDEYLDQGIAKMAGQRREALNAVRANPNIVGHSVTGTIDQGLSGEGLWTIFRELKPGTMDALAEGWAPLKWCLFAQPENVYRGAKVKLEAVLANEDALAPGDYPVRLQVVGPDGGRIFDKTVTVSIPKPTPGGAAVETPFAIPVFAEDVAITGPSGKYRFVATFVSGAAATCGRIEFYAADPAEMPKVESEIVLWGDDPELAQWLSGHGIKARPFASGKQSAREVILVGKKPATGGAQTWRDLITRITQGSAVVFLCPEVFAEGNQPTRWLPLCGKGGLVAGSDLYIRDEWTKKHPIFAGLPRGGLMDYTFYREIIGPAAFTGQDIPTEVAAGAIRAVHGSEYASGCLTAVYRTGAGMYILNTLRIREMLGSHPVAERLLRNMLNYAARDMGQPLAKLPADFDHQLQAIRYE